jgi:hypothetical protein
MYIQMQDFSMRKEENIHLIDPSGSYHFLHHFLIQRENIFNYFLFIKIITKVRMIIMVLPFFAPLFTS